MFNLGFPEVLVILVIMLILFGPNKLPEVGRSIGKMVSELKDALEGKEKE
jgi:TatA/E family protein of Tat protein translocase